MAAVLSRVVAPHEVHEAPELPRGSWRDPSSSLTEIVGSAREELQAGNYENAWTGFQIALEHWLRVKWIAKSGKVNTPVTDRYQLLDKLKSSLTLDDWTNKAIRLTLTRPLPVERWHVELIAAVATFVVVDEVDSTPKLPHEERYGRLHR